MAPLLLCLLAAPLLAATVNDVRLWRAPDHTRIVLDMSAAAEHRLLVLQNPDRIVLDVSDATLQGALADLSLDDTPIARIRSGVRNGTDLRMVFDMRAVVTPRSFAIEANAQAGDRLVLDLHDEAPRPSGTPAVSRSVSDDDRRDIIIAIDAGHGGEDPGALGPGRLREKDVVLAIAKELAALFERDRGFAPTLIRSGDYYVSLKGRRDLARERQADLFVSIHADAFNRKEANGASVYALSTRGATSTTASYLAQRENAADLVGGVRLGDKDEMLAGVLADLSMTSTLDASLNMGGSVLGEMSGVARLHKRQVEQAAFVVLKSPDIPSILVETGFISNPGEARKLADPAYRKRMAQAIHRGIRSWFISHPPPGTMLAFEKRRGGREYRIARGDTLSGIAARFNVSVSDLKSFNQLADNRILVGQTLKIPAL
ncbi:N-acetylmuramoyl-L-alanine amidase [Chromatocurvus halotolerans]|uniref:N-acetylmuramoyl-L-alanine amidase AmiC n=1 Tax=Chromatocurvus halotolerans TaxID=1132028 RepID=A0A4R2KMM0_9GAMM|nr:N-acetylmuramoyl-L-alanine amidase [Chromatocurvus halotolerans]TCO74684.1 N-acetylmuramoyl-L-alanine amidase [Chromatocurvus halotolerans]